MSSSHGKKTFLRGRRLNLSFLADLMYSMVDSEILSV